MKLITIYDAPWKIQEIDEMVKKGVFSSRSEVYREGSLLVLALPEVRRQARKGILDAELFGKSVRECLEFLSRGNTIKAKKRLKDLCESLTVRAFVGPLVGDRADYDTLKETLRRYEEALSKFDKYDDATKRLILRDLSRDLKALLRMGKIGWPKITEGPQITNVVFRVVESPIVLKPVFVKR